MKGLDYYQNPNQKTLLIPFCGNCSVSWHIEKGNAEMHHRVSTMIYTQHHNLYIRSEYILHVNVTMSHSIYAALSLTCVELTLNLKTVKQ